jgi:hypothetical protein
MSSFVCRHCGKVCDSRKGLVQCRWRTRYCFDRELALLNSNNIRYKTADQYLPSRKISSDHRSVYQGYYNTQPNVLPVSQSETGGKEINFGGLLDEDLEEDTCPNFEGVGEEISEAVPNKNMIENFKKHMDHAQRNYLPFQHKNHNAIELLYILQQSRAPLCVYQKIMEWHVNVCSRHLPVGNDAVITQKKVLNELYDPYDIYPNRTIISQQITLSQSKADANIITYDVEWCIQSLQLIPEYRTPTTCSTMMILFPHHPAILTM